MKCRICGKEFDKIRYSKPVDDICSSECHTENFWLEKIEYIDELTIINGECYHVGDEKSMSSFRGFCGKNFIIKYIDGINKDKTVFTTNLWYNGVIPEKFRDKLKDNAIFCKNRIDEFAENLMF